MAVTREQALQILKSLNPAPVFLLSYEAIPLPENLDLWIGCPEEFFLAPESQFDYTGDILVPILDDGNFGRVTFHDPVQGRLIQKSVQSLGEVTEFSNWQQFLAALMINVIENKDDDEAARRISDLIHFRFLSETFEFLDRVAGNPFEQYQDRKAAFISELMA